MASTRFLEVSFNDINGQVQENKSLSSNISLPFAVSSVFWVPVTSAKQLTSGEDVKTIIDLSLDISDLDIKPVAGDTIGIIPKNSPVKVQQLFKRICVEKDADKVCQISVSKTSTKKNASVPSFIPYQSTLRHIFERCIDLQSIPKKLFLKSLLEHTSDPSDQSFLQSLSGRDSEAYTTWTTSGKASIISVLEQCPSCNPPISLLLEHLPRLSPRPYSISYTSDKEKHMHVLFSVLKSDGIPSVGLCTGWLENLTRPLRSKTEDILEEMQNLSLIESHFNNIEKIPIFFRKSNGFTHPKDPLRPLIMVGPGTGVAPFLGFLQERQRLIDKSGKKGVGESWLFFGCRYPDQDNIFQKEIIEYQKQGALSKYIVSYSRIVSEVKYVQDNIRKFGKEVCEMLLEKNGIIYVCGDSANMGRDVKESVRDEIAKMKDISKEEANDVLKSLVTGKQYVEDLWS